MTSIISQIISGLNDLVNSDDFDISPTITPVVDLSDYSSAMSQMSMDSRWTMLTNTQDDISMRYLDQMVAEA